MKIHLNTSHVPESLKEMSVFALFHHSEKKKIVYWLYKLFSWVFWLWYYPPPRTAAHHSTFHHYNVIVSVWLKILIITEDYLKDKWSVHSFTLKTVCVDQGRPLDATLIVPYHPNIGYSNFMPLAFIKTLLQIHF